jgi:hypothetical protein
MPAGFACSRAVLASNTNPPAEIVFELKLKPAQEKPVREILQEQMHMGVGAAQAAGVGDVVGATAAGREPLGPP